MTKEIEYEVTYDVVSTIKYVGEENPGEYYFRITRHWADLVFDDEESEVFAIVNEKGEIELEDYEGGYIRYQEENAIEEMMKEILTTT